MSVVSPLVLDGGRCRQLDADDPLTYPSQWGEDELWNYDWTAQSNASYTTGQGGITHGPFTWSVGIPSGGSVGITNGTGLVVTRGSSGETHFSISSGQLSSYFNNNGRWERGGFAIMVQYTWSLPASGAYGYIAFDAGWPYHWCNLARCRNVSGQPNTSDGGIAGAAAWNGGEYYSGNNITSSDDILCMHILNPFAFNTYVGTYSGGWPALVDMTPVNCQRFGINGTQAQRTGYKPFSALAFRHLIGGATSVTFTFKKIRIVAVHA